MNVALEITAADRATLTWLLDLALRSTLLLAMTFTTFALLRRRSAALRHHVGLVGFASLLVLPLIMSVLPAGLAILPSLESWLLGARSAASGAALPEMNSTWLLLWGSLWAVGALFVLARALVARHAVVGYYRRSREAIDFETPLTEARQRLRTPQAAEVCLSKEVDIPVTFGVWAPKILLPDEACSWSPQRTEMVLLHELAHIRRLDLMSQSFSLLVCGIFWFHPAAWVLSRRLDLEREKACDDLVLQYRGDALEYARQLVAIAEGLRGRPIAAFGVSMARPSQLRTRLKALLDTQVDRRSPKPAQAALLVLLSLALLLPISAVPSSSTTGVTPLSLEPLDGQAEEAPTTLRDEPRGSHRGEQRRSINPSGEPRPVSGPRGHGQNSGHSSHDGGALIREAQPGSHRSSSGHASGDHGREGRSGSHRSGPSGSGSHGSGSHGSGSHGFGSGHSAVPSGAES